MSVAGRAPTPPPPVTSSLPIRSDRMEAVVALAERRGFVYPSAEIYGGAGSAWDYGPLGVELKENIRRQWWRAVVHGRDDVVGLDSAVIQPRAVWEASGHVDAFVDPMTECRSCHQHFRADHVAPATGDVTGASRIGEPPEVSCPACGSRGSLGPPRPVSGLIETGSGTGPDPDERYYLRPETAQGGLVNFAAVVRSARMRPPFGIGQVGKSFRNEVTGGDFLFRTREFEQMGLEFFVPPGTDEHWLEYWSNERMEWYTGLGVSRDNLRFVEHPTDRLAHYAERTIDIEYRFGFGGGERQWGELEGIANRADFDLAAHAAHSGRDLAYFDQTTGERWLPYVIAPAAGLSRSVAMFLLEAYSRDVAPNAKGEPETRVVLRLDPRLAPVKAAVLPLSRNARLSPVARDLAAGLRQLWNTEFDDAGAIGRRYRRQDEIGTPYCVTIDFETLEDNGVTVRERDSMRQERIGLDRVRTYLSERLVGC